MINNIIAKVSMIILFNIFGLHAQQVLLSGTSFDPVVVEDTSRFYWGMNEIKYYGMQSGGIIMNTPLAPNANPHVFNNTHYYAVTNNPNKLDRNRY
ncbi:MAG TPA: hypothetical protein VL947_00440, partial [Cytophagales bacterium]|nr:hypothetical protein [Cytophagales bacterium]